METERRRVVSREWAEGMGSCCLMGVELQFCKMKRALEMVGGDGCTTM